MEKQPKMTVAECQVETIKHIESVRDYINKSENIDKEFLKELVE